jgi:hypothetical protein
MDLDLADGRGDGRNRLRDLLDDGLGDRLGHCRPRVGDEWTLRATAGDDAGYDEQGNQQKTKAYKKVHNGSFQCLRWELASRWLGAKTTVNGRSIAPLGHMLSQISQKAHALGCVISA